MPFKKMDGDKISKVEHPGETGTSFWQTMQFEGTRKRIVKYTKGYLDDHCAKKAT